MTLDKNDFPAQFEAYWQRARPRAMAHARLLTRNSADAEDLLQTTAVRAWIKFETFDRERSFSKWIAVIMMRTFLDRKRAEGRRVRPVSYDAIAIQAEGDSSPLEFPETGPTLEERIVEQYGCGELERALESIPEAHRRTVLMCDFVGLDYTDCAEREGVPVGTVRSRLFRGRYKLRSLLA